MKLPEYAKTVVAAVSAGAVALSAALSDSTVTAGEGVTIALAVLGALGVYALPNAMTAKQRRALADEHRGEVPYGRPGA